MPEKITKAGDSKTYEARKQAIARAMQEARLERDCIHVIAHGKEQWAVLPEGAKRSYKIYRDKTAAVSSAKELARKKSVSSVTLHRRDGMLDRTFDIKHK
jgi:hypothetical protein